MCVVRILYGRESLRKCSPMRKQRISLAAIEDAKRDMESTKIMDRADLWRCGIWKNRGCSSGGFQGGTGEQTGGISGTYHHSGSADL